MHFSVIFSALNPKRHYYKAYVMRYYREQKNNAQTFSRAFSWANNRVCFSFKASCWNIPTSELTCFNVSTCSSVKPSSALLLSCSWCASNVGNSGKLKWIRYLGEPLKFKVSFISLIQRRKSTIKHDLKGLLKQLLNLPLGVIGNVSVVSTVIIAFFIRRNDCKLMNYF